MEVVAFEPFLESETFEWIRAHLRLVPPFYAPSDTEIRSIVREPNLTSSIWYGSFEHTHEILVGLQGGSVAGAAQITFPEDRHMTFPAAGRHALVNWLFGNPAACEAIGTFIAELNMTAERKGYAGIRFDTRNGFGIGWQGIPDCWPHLLRAIADSGIPVSERCAWQSYWTDGEFAEKELPPGFTYTFDIDPDALAAHLCVFDGDTMAGEADIWLPSPLAGELRRKGMFNIEWIEIAEPYRGRRLGQAVLTLALRRMRHHGYRQFMLWTKYDNMHKLAARTGLQKGPTFYWIR